MHDNVANGPQYVRAAFHLHTALYIDLNASYHDYCGLTTSIITNTCYLILESLMVLHPECQRILNS
jgi:hypothetical protein